MRLARFCRVSFLILVAVGFPVAFLLTGSLLPMVRVDDALAHGGAYGLASLLGVLGWGIRKGIVIGLGLIAFGGAIELIQAAVAPSHGAEWSDVAANIFGVVAGTVAASACLGLFRDRRGSVPSRP